MSLWQRLISFTLKNLRRIKFCKPKSIENKHSCFFIKVHIFSKLLQNGNISIHIWLYSKFWRCLKPQILEFIKRSYQTRVWNFNFLIPIFVQPMLNSAGANSQSLKYTTAKQDVALTEKFSSVFTPFRFKLESSPMNFKMYILVATKKRWWDKTDNLKSRRAKSCLVIYCLYNQVTKIKGLQDLNLSHLVAIHTFYR